MVTFRRVTDQPTSSGRRKWRIQPTAAIVFALLGACLGLGAFTFDYASVPGWPHWLGHAIYGVGLVAAFCTAFYMFRAYFLVFHGTYRGDPEVLAHAHESPSAMTGPLVVLAIGSVVLGFLGIPRIGEHLAELNFIDEWLPAGLHAAVEPEYPTEAMPELQLKGFTRPVVAMRVIGDRD